jgi:hypothetical protein
MAGRDTNQKEIVAKLRQVEVLTQALQSHCAMRSAQLTGRDRRLIVRVIPEGNPRNRQRAEPLDGEVIARRGLGRT